MKPNSDSQAGFFLAGIIFVTGLLVTWLFPLSHLVMFPYDLLAARGPHQRWHHILSHSQALWLDFFQWTSVGVVFAALARKERLVLQAPLALCTFTLVTIAMHAGVRSLGMDFYFDLWH